MHWGKWLIRRRFEFRVGPFGEIAMLMSLQRIRPMFVTLIRLGLSFGERPRQSDDEGALTTMVMEP